MKYLVVLFIIAPLFVKSQEINPPKFTNKIIMTTDKDRVNNYRFALQALTDAGFFISSKDSTLATITTLPKPMKKTGSIVIQVVCSNNNIALSGLFKTGLDLTFSNIKINDEWSEVVKKGQKGSVYDISFNYLFDTARSFGLPLKFMQTERSGL